ncbi:MAG TPA: hypothetical protein VER97_09635, partial [Geodermatophilus sp.]|nr:hypothetical protein [Geodermatophilus sp.]
MRASHVATALAAFTAGLVAASALHHRAGRAVPAPVPAVPAAPDDAREAVVLSFPRRTLAALPAARPAVRPAASPAASP